MLEYNYHDAILLTGRLDWEAGTSELTVDLSRPPSTTVILKSTGVIDFAWPRKFPWRRSESINEIREHRVDQIHTVEIEMQSGDLITIQATNTIEVDKDSTSTNPAGP